MSLYNEEVGMWEYNLSGVGVRPGMMDPTRITATLGSDGSSFVSWRNPFADPVKVSLTYTLAGQYPYFCLCPGFCTWVPWALLAPAFGLDSALVFGVVTLALLALVFGLCLCLCSCMPSAVLAPACDFASAFVFASACCRVCFWKFTLLHHEDTCGSAPHHATLDNS